MFWCSHSNDPPETGQQKRGGPSGFQATSKWKSLHGHDPCTKGETFLKTVVSIYLFCVHFFWFSYTGVLEHVKLSASDVIISQKGSNGK